MAVGRERRGERLCCLSWGPSVTPSNGHHLIAIPRQTGAPLPTPTPRDTAALCASVSHPPPSLPGLTCRCPCNACVPCVPQRASESARAFDAGRPATGDDEWRGRGGGGGRRRRRETPCLPLVPASFVDGGAGQQPHRLTGWASASISVWWSMPPDRWLAGWGFVPKWPQVLYRGHTPREAKRCSTLLLSTYTLQKRSMGGTGRWDLEDRVGRGRRRRGAEERKEGLRWAIPPGCDGGGTETDRDTLCDHHRCTENTISSSALFVSTAATTLGEHAPAWQPSSAR